MTDPAQIREKVLALETVLLRQDPSAIPQVHESTVAAMSLMGDPAGNVCKVHIYTDGSFKEAEGDAAQEAGWAFVVILEHACTEYSFHGFERLRLEARECVLLHGLVQPKQDVILRSLLLSHGRVVGVFIICVWNPDCVDCL